jgi:hypothetical protein
MANLYVKSGEKKIKKLETLTLQKQDIVFCFFLVCQKSKAGENIKLSCLWEKIAKQLFF